MNKKSLKQRLKFWHIHCMNCGCKIAEIDKNIEEVVRDEKCPDCKNTIHTRIGVEFFFNLSIGKEEEWHIIECKWHF